MATKKLKKPAEGGQSVDISGSLISDLNVKFGKRVAYNLSETEAPTTIKRWISTGSVQLDYLCRNAPGGGYPEGRITEISGPPSIGKSHLAYHVASNIQKMGGIVVYCDTETATQLEKLSRMGIDIKNNFVYVDEHCTEDVFTLIETTILRARELLKNNFDIPICIIYDSIAGSSPKAELEGTYDQNTVGLQARVLSKGFRKIVGVIGSNNILLICINQLRDKIGATKYEDPFVTPGGKALPYHSSVRIRLTSGTVVKDKKGVNIIGIHVKAKVIKNKVAPALKSCDFDILFGKGISEHTYIYDVVSTYLKDNGQITATIDGEELKLMISGTGAWKTLMVTKQDDSVVLEKKFYKEEFNVIMRDYAKYVDKIIEKVYVMDLSDVGSDIGDEPDTDEGLNEGEEEIAEGTGQADE